MSDSIIINDIKRDFIDGTNHKISILKGINFSLTKGEATAIMGPSGAGKSVLLHILGGLDKPTSGNCILEGKNIYALTGKQISKWRNNKIGFVFQYHNLLVDFTAIENVMMPALIDGVSSKKAKEMAKIRMEEVNLSHRLNNKVLKLSGGEQQRVAIARALINNPSFILADEPTGSLDYDTSNKIMDLLLKSVKKNNSTLLIVTHNEEISKRLDSVWYLKKGILIK